MVVTVFLFDVTYEARIVVRGFRVIWGLCVFSAIGVPEISEGES